MSAEIIIVGFCVGFMPGFLFKHDFVNCELIRVFFFHVYGGFLLCFDMLTQYSLLQTLLN